MLTFDINPEIRELIEYMLDERDVTSVTSAQRIGTFATKLLSAPHPLPALTTAVGHLLELKDHSLALCGQLLPISVSVALLHEGIDSIKQDLEETAIALTGGGGLDFSRRCAELSALGGHIAQILSVSRAGAFGECAWHRERMEALAVLSARFDAFFLEAACRLDFLIQHYCLTPTSLPGFIDALASALDIAIERNPSTLNTLCNRIDSWLAAGAGRSFGPGVSLAGALHMLQARARSFKPRALAGFRAAIASEDHEVAQQIGECLAAILFEYFFATPDPDRLLGEVLTGRYAGNYKDTLDKCVLARSRANSFCDRLVAALDPGSERGAMPSEIEQLICEIVLLSHGRGLEGFLKLGRKGSGRRSHGTNEEERRLVRSALFNAKCAVIGFLSGILAKVERLSAHPPVLVDLAELLERAPTPEYLAARVREIAILLTDRLCGDLVAGIRWCHAEDLPAFLNRIFALLAGPGFPAEQKARVLASLATAIFSKENSIYSVARAAALRKFLIVLRCRSDLASESGIQPLIERIEREGWLPESWGEFLLLEKGRQVVGDEFDQLVRRPLHDLVTGISKIFEESPKQGLGHSLEWQFRELGFNSELELLEIDWPREFPDAGEAS